MPPPSAAMAPAEWAMETPALALSASWPVVLAKMPLPSVVMAPLLATVTAPAARLTTWMPSFSE